MRQSQATPNYQEPRLLSFALGIVFFHFGILKFFPDMSSAEMIASQTVMRLTGGYFDGRTAMESLAVLECVIGLGFLFRVGLRVISVLFVIHMIGTFLPLVVLPELTFQIAPFAPTLEGQYILKNLVFVAAAWTVLLPYCFPRGINMWVGDIVQPATDADSTSHEAHLPLTKPLRVPGRGVPVSGVTRQSS